MEFFESDDMPQRIHVISVSDAIITISGMNSLIAALVGNGLYIMTLNGWRRFGFVGILDGTAVAGVGDCEDLADAPRPGIGIRRRAAVVLSRVTVSVRDRIDVPILVITELRSVPLKISVA